MIFKLKTFYGNKSGKKEQITNNNVHGLHTFN